MSTVNKENLEKAINAALEGPEERGLRIAEYRFNVKPAEIRRDGDTIRVVGGEDNRYISRRRRGRPNDRIYYRFDKVGDEIRALEVEIDRGGLRRAIPRAIGDIIREIPRPLPPFPHPPHGRGAAGTTGPRDAESARRAAYAETERLLDGSWEGESQFLVANIALRVR